MKPLAHPVVMLIVALSLPAPAQKPGPSPTPAKGSVPGVLPPAGADALPPAALEAMARPYIAAVSPARVHPGETFAVLGSNLSFKGGARLRLTGKTGTLDPTFRILSASRIEVQIPAKARPGRYAVTIVDQRAVTLSNAEMSVMVAPSPVRVTLEFEVWVACFFDVPSMPGSVEFRLEPLDESSGSPATASLRGGPSRPASGSFAGGFIYPFRGPVNLEPGRYQAVPSPAASFAVNVFRQPDVYSYSQECARRLRQYQGRALVAERQTRRFLLEDVTPLDVVTGATFRVRQFVNVLDLGSLAPPTSVK